MLQDGEYINTNVYKVGRTTQLGDTRSLNRLKWYSVNTVQVYLRKVDTEKVVEIEKDIISVFKLKYNLVRGAEWFSGNTQQIIADIDTIINKYPELETADIASTVSKDSKFISTIENLENSEKVEDCNIIDDTFCERCGMSFKSKKYLIQHLQKESECVCLYSDITRLDILTKIKQRTGIECGRCNRIYKNKETVRKHNCKGCNLSLIQKPLINTIYTLYYMCKLYKV